MADDEVKLVVSGIGYGGWKSIRVTQSMESLAGSFALEVSDRWDGKKSPWPIAEGAACRVELGGEVLINGYVFKRDVAADASSRTLGYEGRDKSANLVDCSALVQAGSISKGKWTFTNVDLAGLAHAIATDQFGLFVNIQAGLGALLVKNKKVVLHPGDTGFEVIAKEAAAAGVMVISDGDGGIVITRGSDERAAPLVEGKGGNLKGIKGSYDMTERFHRYLISSQVPGSDEQFGEDVNIQAEAIDLGVRDVSRVLLIRPDKGYNAADAKRRADWEARIRAARSEKISAVVQGWRQPNGERWKVNRLTHVYAPVSAGIDGDLRISTVEYTVSSEGGRTTQLSLVRPDAFTPEPTATVKESSGLWEELAKGAK